MSRSHINSILTAFLKLFASIVVLSMLSGFSTSTYAGTCVAGDMTTNSVYNGVDDFELHCNAADPVIATQDPFAGDISQNATYCGTTMPTANQDCTAATNSFTWGASETHYFQNESVANQYFWATEDGAGGFTAHSFGAGSGGGNTLPALGGTFTTNGMVNDDASISPFSSVTVTDGDGDNVSVSITYTGANGTISGTGLTGTAGNYTITSAAPATAQSNLQGLVFTPTENQVTAPNTVVTGFTLTPNDGTGDGASDATTQVTATSINDGPAIAGDLAVAVNQGDTVTITTADLTENDPDDSGVGLTYTITSDPGTGTLFVDANDNGTADGGEERSTGGTATFTQANIDANRLKYAHDNSNANPDSFQAILADGGEDGAAATGASTVNITVAGAPMANQAPTSIGISNSTLKFSDAADGFNVGTLSAVDADGDPISYSLASAGSSASGTCSSSAGNGFFKIGGTSLQTNTGQIPAQDHNICVQANDGSTTFEQTLTITVTSDSVPNVVPTAITLSPDSIKTIETGIDKRIGFLSSDDTDAGDFSFGLVSAGTSAEGACDSDANNDRFKTILNSLHSNSALAAGSYDVCVQVNDGITTFEQSLTITVESDSASDSQQCNTGFREVGGNCVEIMLPTISTLSGIPGTFETGDTFEVIVTADLNPGNNQLPESINIGGSAGGYPATSLVVSDGAWVAQFEVTKDGNNYNSSQSIPVSLAFSDGSSGDSGSNFKGGISGLSISSTTVLACPVNATQNDDGGCDCNAGFRADGNGMCEVIPEVNIELAVSNSSFSLTEGEEGSFSVSISDDSEESVSIEVTGGDGININQGSSFSLSDASDSKTVEFAIIDNTTVDGARDRSITVSAEVGDKQLSETINVSIDDNDVLDFTATPSITEVPEGSSLALELGLTADASADVSFEVSSSAPNRINIEQASPIKLTTDSSAAIVFALDNDIDELESESTVVLTVTASLNGQEIGTKEVDITIADNDQQGILVSPNAQLSLTEGDVSTSFFVSLQAQPLADVTLQIASDSDRLTISPNQLTLSPDDWDSSQSINVGVIDDQLITGIENVTISLSPQSTDPTVAALSPVELNVMVEDNDTKKIGRLTADLAKSRVNEKGDVTLTQAFTETVDGITRVEILLPVELIPLRDAAVFLGPNNSDSTQVNYTLTFNSGYFLVFELDSPLIIPAGTEAILTVPEVFNSLAGKTDTGSTITLFDSTGQIIAESSSDPYQILEEPPTTIFLNQTVTAAEESGTDLSGVSIATFSTIEGQDDSEPGYSYSLISVADSNGACEAGSDSGNSSLTIFADGSLGSRRRLPGGDYPLCVQVSDAADGSNVLVQSIVLTLQSPTPNITAVTIPNESKILGETITATLTIEPAEEDFSDLTLAGTIGGFGVSNFLRASGSTYTAQLSIPIIGDEAESDTGGSGVPTTFTVFETAGVVEFGGTSTGNITVSWSDAVGDSVATFTRGGIVARTMPDFETGAAGTATQITLAAGQILLLSSADADLLLANVDNGVDGDGEISRLPADIPAGDSVPVNLSLNNDNNEQQATYTESIVQNSDAVLTTPAAINLSLQLGASEGVSEGESFTVTATALDAFANPWPRALTIPLNYADSEASIADSDSDFTGPTSVDIAANSENGKEATIEISTDNVREPGVGGNGEIITVAIDKVNLPATAQVGKNSSQQVRIIDVQLPEILGVTLNEGPHLIGDTVTATVRVAANDEDFSENGSLSGSIAGLEINSSSFVQVGDDQAATDLYRATFNVSKSESNSVSGNPIEVAGVSFNSGNQATTLADTSPNNLNGPGLTDGVHSTALNQQFVFSADRDALLAESFDAILEFRFSEATSLDGLRIWNSRYERDVAGTNIFTDWGIKELDAVFVLADGQEVEQSYELLEASDNNGAVLAIPSAVSGLSVSRVQLIPRSNHGGRNFGLAEVQFLTYPSSVNGGSSAVVATNFPAGNNIPVNLTLTNGDGVSSLAFTSPISQNNDAIYRTPIQVEFDSTAQLSVNEGGSQDLNFKFTPSGVLGTRSSNVPLSYGGTATPAMDYTQASRPSFFGESLSVEVTIDVNSDTESGEGVETIEVSIDGSQLPSYLQVGDRDSITISINNLPDDQSTSVAGNTDMSSLFSKFDDSSLTSVRGAFKGLKSANKAETLAIDFLPSFTGALTKPESIEVSALAAQPLSQDSESGDITGSVDTEASTSLVCAGSSELRGEVCIDTDSMARILSTNPTGASDANGAFWYLTPQAVLVSNAAEDSYFGTDDGLVLIDIGQQGEGRRMAYTIGTLDLNMAESTGVTVNDSGIFVDASGADAGIDTVALNGLATVDFGEATKVSPIAVTDGSAFAETGIYYVAAANPVTFLVDNASDTGLSLDTASTDPSMGSAYITYEDSEGGKRRQELVRWPRFWNVFQATLEQTAGVTRARIDSTGLITVTANGGEVKAVADYLVQGSDIPIGFSDAATGVFFDFAGDLNGDGIMDYTLFWPNGDRQSLFILTQ